MVRIRRAPALSMSALMLCLFTGPLGPARAQDVPPGLIPQPRVFKVQPGFPKSKLPPVSPFLSSPRPVQNDDDRPDIAIGEGVSLTGHLGAGPQDGSAPSEPSAFKTKRAPIVPRGDEDFALGKHALSDGVTVGISLDLPSLGGN